MIEFIAAILFLIITPGPGVLSVAGTGAAYGFNTGLRYLFGLLAGNTIVALMVITGAATILLSVAYVSTVLLVLSVLYLLYLAYRIGAAGAEVAFKKPPKAPNFFDGVILQLLNPKCYAVNASLFLGFLFMPETPLMQSGLKLAIFTLLWIPVHLGWLMAGVYLHSLNLSSKAQKRINIVMATSMVIVVILALLSLK